MNANQKIEIVTDFRNGNDIANYLVNNPDPKATVIIGGNLAYTLRAVRNKYKYGFVVELKDDRTQQCYGITGFNSSDKKPTVQAIVEEAEAYIQKNFTTPKPPVLKGLHVGIYESKQIGNCSNGGISQRCKTVTLVGAGIPEIFEASNESPAVKLVRRNIGGRNYVHAEPVEAPPEGYTPYCDGGAIIDSSDSRFSRVVDNGGYPISLHDRTDTWADYERLSI